MKTASDPRHQRRRAAVQELFAQSFKPEDSPDFLDVENELAKNVVSSVQQLDSAISASAPAWPIEKLNKIDLAILRIAVWELKNTETPPKVVIDEAVELAKEFGSESSPSFVNGVLGTVFATIEKEKNEG